MKPFRNLLRQILTVVASKKKVTGSAVVLVASLGMIALGQNCSSKSRFAGSELSTSSATAFSEEDDIWFRLESAKIKIKQLNAIAGFSDNVSNEVLEGKSPVALAGQLQTSVNDIEKMLLDKKMAANDTNVIKKYTSLVDLLSNARDMLLAFYMNQGFAQTAKDLEEAKSKLRNSIDLLSASLDNLKLSHTQLQSQVTNQGEQITQLRRDFMTKMNALEAKLEARIDAVQVEIMQTISQLNTQLSQKIVANEAAIAALDGRVINIDARVKEIEDKLKPQVEYLISLAESTRRDLDAFAAQFEELRNAGEETYGEMISNWNCADDLINKNGTETLNLPASIGESCVYQKEETLYKICVERYPTFCGPCAGKTMAQCAHWNNPQIGLTAMEKLEILINMRQEITIEYLTQQTTIHKQALFGTGSCKTQCLQLSNGNLPASCTVSDLNQCGVEGQLIALKITDLNLINNMLTLSNDMNDRIDSLSNDFAASRDYSNQRFAQLQSYVDENFKQIRTVTEQKFNSIVSALSGIQVVSKPLYDEMTKQCLASSQANAHAVASKALITAPLNTIPGWNALSPQAIVSVLEADIEDALRVTSQSAINASGAGSLASILVSLRQEVFTALNMDQKNIPAYDGLLATKVASACPAQFKTKSPFTNVVGRDPMDLIAVGVARRVLMGDGAGTVGGNVTAFNKYKTPIIKGSLLQQAFFSAVLDYREDVSKDVPSSCLSAIEDYTKQVLSTPVVVRAGEATTIVQTLNSGTIQGILLNLSEQAKLLSSKLESIESTIIARAVVLPDDASLKKAVQDVALRLIQASTLYSIAAIKADDCDGLTAAYRELVPGGNQSQFDLSLQEYVKQKNALAAANAETFNKLNEQIAALKAANQNQATINANVQKQIKDLQDAVGSLPTYAAVQDMIDALNIPAIKKQIEVLENKVNQIPVPDNFTPRISAVRHNFDVGTADCNGAKLSALAFPTSSQFNGGYLACNVNFRIVAGDGHTTNWAFGSNASSKFWLKMWGAATKIDVRVMSNSIEVASMNGSFSGLSAGGSKQTAQGVNLKLASGELKDGAFMMNYPSLLGGFANYGYGQYNPTFKITPYNEPVNKTGAQVNYTFTLYSPLVLAFNQSETLSTLHIGEGVNFDLMGKGVKQQTGWVAAEKGAFLALDLNGNGRIDDGRELFGQATVLADGREARNGFEALAAYDSNGDNVIDSKDPVFADLKLWFDLKTDGRSQARELASLDSMDVKKISLEYKELDQRDQMNNDNRVLYKAKFHGPKVCGDEGCTVFDVFFNNALIH